MLWYIVFSLILIKTVVIYRGIHILPVAELKRRARNREPGAHAIYKIAASYMALDLLLFLLGATAAIWLIIMASQTAWWVATLAILSIVLLLFGFSKPKVNGPIWKIMAATSPLIFKATSFMLPTLSRLAAFAPKPTGFHTGIYEKDDLLEIINKQNHQVDSRIPEQDLTIVKGALSFGDKKVSDAMTPRRATRFVSEAEMVGPMLMDELHKVGFNIFPVIKAASKPATPEVIGMLYLDDLIDNPDKSKVKDVMQSGKDYIDETKDLRFALDEFIKTKKHLLVVTNNFQEVVGVLTLQAVIEQIIGKKLPLES